LGCELRVTVTVRVSKFTDEILHQRLPRLDLRVSEPFSVRF